MSQAETKTRLSMQKQKKKRPSYNRHDLAKQFENSMFKQKGIALLKQNHHLNLFTRELVINSHCRGLN